MTNCKNDTHPQKGLWSSEAVDPASVASVHHPFGGCDVTGESLCLLLDGILVRASGVLVGPRRRLDLGGVRRGIRAAFAAQVHRTEGTFQAEGRASWNRAQSPPPGQWPPTRWCGNHVATGRPMAPVPGTTPHMPPPLASDAIAAGSSGRAHQA